MNIKKSLEPAYKVKGVDLLFHASNGSPYELIALSSIHLSSKQPRRYFDPDAMESLIKSIKSKGILQPILVRSKGVNNYEVVAGERRYRAAKEVGLQNVPVFIKDLSDEETFEIALLENLQREDLNPVEETEGILDLLSLKLNRSREAIISLLHLASHADRESANNVIHSPEWQQIEEIFSIVGKLTPNSFRTNRLPLLNLPQDTLEYLRQGKIEYTKAKEIARVKDGLQRQSLLLEAMTKKLSLSQIKERIANLKIVNVEAESEGKLAYQSRLKAISAKAKKAENWKDAKKKKRFEKLLAEIENLLTEDDAP